MWKVAINFIAGRSPGAFQLSKHPIINSFRQEPSAVGIFLTITPPRQTIHYPGPGKYLSFYLLLSPNGRVFLKSQDMLTYDELEILVRSMNLVKHFLVQLLKINRKLALIRG